MRITITVTQDQGWQSDETTQLNVSYASDPPIIGPIQAEVIVMRNDPPTMTVLRVNTTTVVTPITILPGGVEEAIMLFLDEQRKHPRISQMRIECVYQDT